MTYSVSIGEGPDVVLVHGVLSSIHCWDHTIPALVQAGYRCHALDLLGHGESKQPNTPKTYDSTHTYDHMADWIDSLELKKPFYFVGHSLGGYLSLRYALKNPQKVHSLALIAPYFSPNQVTLGVKLAILAPKLASKIFPLFPRWFLRLSAKYLNNTKGLNRETQEHLANDQHRAHPYTLFYGIPTIEDLLPKISTHQLPTILIWGDGDRSLQTKYFAEFLAQTPQTEFYEIKGTGHIPQLTDAISVNQRILKLFNNIDE